MNNYLRVAFTLRLSTEMSTHACDDHCTNCFGLFFIMTLANVTIVRFSVARVRLRAEQTVMTAVAVVSGHRFVVGVLSSSSVRHPHQLTTLPLVALHAATPAQTAPRPYLDSFLLEHLGPVSRSPCALLKLDFPSLAD